MAIATGTQQPEWVGAPWLWRTLSAQIRPEDALAALSKAGKNPQGEFIDDLFLMALIHWKLDRVRRRSHMA